MARRLLVKVHNNFQGALCKGHVVQGHPLCLWRDRGRKGTHSHTNTLGKSAFFLIWHYRSRIYLILKATLCRRCTARTVCMLVSNVQWLFFLHVSVDARTHADRGLYGVSETLMKMTVASKQQNSPAQTAGSKNGYWIAEIYYTPIKLQL